jgi:predicted nucleic acid-binding protein
MAGEGGLVLDASVLIDYVARDKDLLALVSAHIAPIVIPLHVLAEVDGLDEAEAIALGMTVCVPADDQVDEAMDRPRGLSFEDYLCFATARDLGLVCVTNDDALRAHCTASGIASMRGFRPLIRLVEAEVVSPLRSVRVVRAIYVENGFITRAVVVSFVREVWAVRRGVGGPTDIPRLKR